MKILVVHPRMGVKGGGERVAIHSIAATLKAGHEVSLVSEEFDQRSFEDFFGCNGLFDGIERLSYPAFSPTIKGGFLLYQRLRYHQRWVRRVLSAGNRFDIVLSTQDIGYVPTVDSPVVQYCYFPDYFAHLESHPSLPWWGLYYWPASRFYRERVRRVDRLLSVSEFTRGFVRKKWGRDSTTLYPPCPIEIYQGVSRSRENLVVTVGRIVPEKRLHLLVDMANQLPDYRFAIIGSVEEQKAGYYERLRTLAPSNVSFVLSPLRKVKDMLGAAKVYVHCALNEHFGITIVEAMAAGCVPVVHDSGGPREIVAEGVGYRWRDSSEAVEQVSRLMEDRQLWGGLSSAASARARQYGPERFESGLVKALGRYES